MDNRRKTIAVLSVAGSMALGLLLLFLYGLSDRGGATVLLLILGVLFMGAGVFFLSRIPGKGRSGSGKTASVNQTNPGEVRLGGQKLPIRYKIDFLVTPGMFFRDKQKFVGTFLSNPGEYLAQIYTNTYRAYGSGNYSPKDFSARVKAFPDGTDVCYVTLPPLPAEDGSHVYCTAWMLVRKAGQEPGLYGVEASTMGTGFISLMAEKEKRVTIGPAGKTMEENLSILASARGIRELTVEDLAARHKVPPEAVSLGRTPAGGAYSILHRNGRHGVIEEYDANHLLLQTTTGTFGGDKEEDEKEREEADGGRTGELTVESIAALHGVAPEAVSLGRTPAGGAYSILFRNGRYGSIHEYDENHQMIESTTGTFGSDDEDSEEPEKEAPEKSELLKQLRQTEDSCISAPLQGTDFDNVRWLSGRIQYFRDNGIPEEKLYVLEMRILQHMPGFVAENFRDYLEFLKFNLTPIAMGLERLMEAGKYTEAKAVAELAAWYLQENEERLIRGRHCFRDAFEAAVHTMEWGRAPETPATWCNVTAFLVTYAKLLRQSGQYEQSRAFLEYTLNISPENAAVWMELGDSWVHEPRKQLECYGRALRYCYEKDGPYGLPQIYLHMAQSFLELRRTQEARAVLDCAVSMGANPGNRFAQLQPAARPWLDVMREAKIQVGFSEPVVSAAMELRGRQHTDKLPPEITRIVNAVLS